MRILLTALLAVAAAAGASAADATKPNVVFILSDDQGYADAGWHGNEIKTPNLDKIAAAGARLDAFYAQPVASPARAAPRPGPDPTPSDLTASVDARATANALPHNERTLPRTFAGV